MTGLINVSGYGNITRDARNEMGNRGSKSDKSSVKEQRVDGSSTCFGFYKAASCLIYFSKVVRYTLVAGKPVLVRNN